MPIWPFQRSRADQDAVRLLAAVTEASRRAAFFGDDRVPDTLEGRFELMTLNGALALIRLREDKGARPLAQAFTDKMFRYFDAGLREAGVGDTAVPKRMTKFASAFYGRLDAYGVALGDAEALQAALARNVWRAQTHAYAPELAAYAMAVSRHHAGCPVSAMFAAEGWPAP